MRKKTFVCWVIILSCEFGPSNSQDTNLAKPLVIIKKSNLAECGLGKASFVSGRSTGGFIDKSMGSNSHIEMVCQCVSSRCFSG